MGRKRWADSTQRHSSIASASVLKDLQRKEEWKKKKRS